MIPYIVLGPDGTCQCTASKVSYTVYFLKSCTTNRTYVGYTNNIYRRILEHNGYGNEGAKRTKAGRPWKVVCILSGFPTSRAALQFEYAWHQIRAPRKRTKNGPDGKRRYIKCPHIIDCNRGLQMLFEKKWTQTAPEPHSFPLTCIWNTGSSLTYEWKSRMQYSCWSVFFGEIDYNTVIETYTQRKLYS